ncbi:MAG: TaqI-like C-terminal specificity domain-containing protein [Euryarchaeota archaeon]|nr:TaqI-like C-terminal specificity domain-containing protein [Euryarchaeota archaeon]
MAQNSFQFVNNKHLFSNYYLENQINSTLEWRKQDHESAFQEIRKIYDREIDLVRNLNESQLEDRFFREIFKGILPNYEVQGITLAKEFPDYAFFPDQESQDRAQRDKDTESFFKEALAIGEVKKWDIELDRFGKDRHNKKRNPSFQTWLYLHDTEPKWGILSNGRMWRLYHQDKALDVYYEVDLAFMLESGDLESFRYFYYFFRKEAFLPNEKGEIFLDVVLKGSQDYAQEIGDNLKENVYRAMKNIAEGFFHWEENGLDPNNPADRALAQKNTMILLYRFLFMLYAEGKALLDLKDEQYRNSYSFDRLKKGVADREDGPQKGHYLPIKTTLWGELNDIFRLIDQGSKVLGIDDQIHVPAYNGGLFDPERHPDLERWTIGDSFLASAIDLLSRSKVNSGARGFVDYSTLEIRHLGSIYEGLLEYKLEVAEEDLVVTGGKDRKWVTQEEFNGRRKNKMAFEDFNDFDKVKKGKLYLTTDKGERKATGSYYTPDYIVDYIVENTVGPVVRERWNDALSENRSLIGATLSVKVLDPAIGSGHFLVGAVEFLAGKLMQAAERDIDWSWVEDHGQFTNEWAKREVVSHCVYGVDLNELAVELAKVSLWLTTIAKDKPLSFLDHRLKQGNSLIGARLSDLKFYPGANSGTNNKDQVTLPSFVSPLFIRHLIGKIEELEQIRDDSLSEIKRKEEVFEEFKSLPEYTKAKAIASVHTAVYFGNEVEPRTTPQGTKSADLVYHDLFWAVGGDEREWTRKTSSPWFNRAQEIAEVRDFFHWELEFPEVFFEGGAVKDNPGWDAVVGNPPYVRGRVLPNEEKDFYNEKFAGAFRSYDLYVLFVELGLDLIRDAGLIGMITPRSILTESYGEAIRKFVLEKTKIISIVDLLGVRVFEDASVINCILTLQTVSDYQTHVRNIIKIINFSMKYSHSIEQSVFWNTPRHTFRVELTPNMLHLEKKINATSVKLGDFCYVSYSIAAHSEVEGKGKSSYLSNTILNNKYKPFIEGKEIDRYVINWRGRYLKYDPQILRRPSLPELFENPKIVICGISGTSGISATFDKDKLYVGYPAICLTLKIYLKDTNRSDIVFSDVELELSRLFNLRYILAVVNSSIMKFYFKTMIFSTSQTIYSENIRDLPIRRITFTTPAEERARLISELKELYAAQGFEEILGRVESCLSEGAEGEKSDVVHDLLAFLAEQMIQMNKDKQEEIKDFLGWLEREIGAKVAELTNKTKVQSYFEGDFEQLLAILKKNKRKLSIDPVRRPFQKELRREFSESMDKLDPLLTRIEETDRLIDQIVYRLYGLNDEEIKIVE